MWGGPQQPPSHSDYSVWQHAAVLKHKESSRKTCCGHIVFPSLANLMLKQLPGFCFRPLLATVCAESKGRALAGDKMQGGAGPLESHPRCGPGLPPKRHSWTLLVRFGSSISSLSFYCKCRRLLHSKLHPQSRCQSLSRGGGVLLTLEMFVLYPPFKPAGFVVCDPGPSLLVAYTLFQRRMQSD